MTKSMWMVRSAQGRMYDDFKAKEFVAIGWQSIGKIDPTEDAKDTAARLEQAGKTVPPGLYAGVAQLHRFASEVQVGDRVISYSPSLRKYLVGTVTGDWRFDSAPFGESLAN